MKYLRYLWYIIRHKWFVFLAGLRVGAPIYNLIVHDLSKLLPDEFFPYADYFYDEAKQKREFNQVFLYYGLSEAAPFGYYVKDRYNVAWLLHQKRNPHHWQYWYLINDTDPSISIPMPQQYAREMVADWMGAGRTLTGKWGAKGWYKANKNKMLLHPETRGLVELLLELEFEVKTK